jgi:hypothetical protein
VLHQRQRREAGAVAHAHQQRGGVVAGHGVRNVGVRTAPRRGRCTPGAAASAAVVDAAPAGAVGACWLWGRRVERRVVVCGLLCFIPNRRADAAPALAARSGSKDERRC